MATTETQQLPHIEVFHRVIGLPVVEMALSKSAETYSMVKESHQLVHWILTMAEASLSNATKQAVPIAAPIAKKLENPIHFVDHTLCLGLDKIEQRVPFVKEKPEQILKNAYSLAMKTVRPAVLTIAHVNELIIAQAATLRDLSWSKANQILGTRYGTAAVKGFDSTVLVADKLIDKYFPAIEEEEPIAVTSDEEDKLLHTLKSVGRLSNKTARRVYSNIIHHVRILNKDHFKMYIASLVEFLHLTRYLHTNDQKVQNREEPSEGDATSNPEKETRKDQ